MYCKNCGKEVNEKAVACLNCGMAPLSEKKFCQECGAETKENQVVCVKCGVSLDVKVKSGDFSKLGIYRSSDRKILAGVCAGLADKFNMPVALIRVLWVLLSFAAGLGIISYIIIAMTMPAKPTK